MRIVSGIRLPTSNRIFFIAGAPVCFFTSRLSIILFLAGLSFQIYASIFLQPMSSVYLSFGALFFILFFNFRRLRMPNSLTPYHHSWYLFNLLQLPLTAGTCSVPPLRRDDCMCLVIARFYFLFFFVSLI